MKTIRWASAAFVMIFLILMAVRLDLWTRFFPDTEHLSPMLSGTLPEKDTWMNLYLKDRKIGYSHSTLTKTDSGYRMDESLFMRMNIMGFSEDVRMATTADLNADLSLESFVFNLHSGIFEFNAQGEMQPGNRLSVTTRVSGSPQETVIALDYTPYLTGGVLHAAARDFKTTGKDQFTFHVFDPATMSQTPVTVNVIGKEEITISDQDVIATRLTVTFKGSVQTAWLDETGDILREKGLLGMTLEKTSKENALAGLPLTGPDEDITELASVNSNVTIDHPRKTVFLAVRLSGIETASLYLDGGRQTLSDNMLSVARENPEDISKTRERIDPDALKPFLQPEPFIGSDHPKISALASKIVSSDDPPMTRARKLVDWVFKNIEKRPVISIPDALTTLENRMGDCNEHAVLLAALARAAGIPAKIESGLAYLNGRFYYHAWNLLYVGQWITADAVFGLMPADAARIRFASGSPRSQLDLLPVIDRVEIEVVEVR